MNFSEKPPSKQWAALKYRGEKIAEVWFKPEGEPFALAFRIPSESFQIPGMGQRLTAETLLKAVAIATEEVESWRHGGVSHSAPNGSGPQLRSPLPQPPPDAAHLDIYVRLKPPPQAVAPKESGAPEVPEAKWQDLEARWTAILSAAPEIGLDVRPELTASLGTYFEASEMSMMQRGYEAAMLLLERTRDFTALMAFNDGSAIGAIRAIQDIGLSVPNHLSVVGIDDIQASAFTCPRLTTIRQPLKLMGALAAATLLQRIQGEAVPEETVVAPELVVRESTAPVHL